jgi:hypothetical protein
MSQAFTELQAVNKILAEVRHRRISSLTDLDEGDVPALVLEALRDTSRQVQLYRFPENYSPKYTLTATAEGKFVVPSTALSVDPTYLPGIVQQGDYLYDVENDTQVFTATTIEVDIVWYREFDTLPPVVQDHIIAQATVVAYGRVGPRDMPQEQARIERATVAPRVSFMRYTTNFVGDRTKRNGAIASATSGRLTWRQNLRA